MTNRKGIILAGGTGSRLFPITQATSKQLLPVYDKPMVYYPLCTLMLSGIRDILLISTPDDELKFSKLLGDGSQWGLNIQYAIQSKPMGLAHAYIIGKDFINNGPSSLVLGDNIFYGHNLQKKLLNASQLANGASIFAYRVNDPKRYGVVTFDRNKKAKSIIEKPKSPKSNFAVTGLYFYDNQACDIAKELKPSSRGELEITDLNLHYLKKDQISVEIMGRGYAWFDTGTQDSLLEASSFISTIQKRQGLQVSCPEEIAFDHGWITTEALVEIADSMKTNQYGRYLLSLID